MPPPDEQDGDSNKAVKQMHPNMKTPAVKATGKAHLPAPTPVTELSRISETVYFVFSCRGVILAWSL